jgi:tetratricopeptide (TPR) repeat protein
VTQALGAQAEALLAQVAAAAARQQVFASLVSECCDWAISANAAGRPDLSIALMTPLSAAAPRVARVWQLLGLAYRDEEDLGSALVALAKAAALAPDDALIAHGHARTAMEAGHPAAGLFKRARDLAPGDVGVVLGGSAALLAERKANAAKAQLEKVLAERPGWSEGHEALSTLRYLEGDEHGFARSYKAALAQLPGDLDLRLSAYRTYSRVGALAEAQGVIDEGRSALGGLPELDAAEAYLATESGNDDRAERLFQQAKGFDDAGTHVGHIRHCLRTGRVERALSIVESMLSGPMANQVWPYASIIWRLLGDDRARWLDGDPPYVGVFDLDIDPDDLAMLADCLLRLHVTRHHPPEQSVRGGTQTDGPLFSRLDPAIRMIRARAFDAVRAYTDALPAVDPGHPLLGTPRTHLRFAGSWSVRLAAQGFHVVHTHPLGWISSAFYVSLPDADSLGPAPAGWLELGAPSPDLRLDLPGYMTIEPKPGRLVLFPSTMWHGTVPFNDGERLTIAFDVATPTR